MKVAVKRSCKKFSTIENQRKFMDELYFQFKLSKLDDWTNIQKQQIIKEGGKGLLQYYYENDMKKLLSSIYPTHQWNFSSMTITPNIYFKKIENQRQFLDKLFKILQLTHFEEWKYISKKKIIENGGKSLLNYYAQNLFILFTSIYPNYPFEYEKFEFNTPAYFNSLQNQQKYMESLFKKLNLITIENFLKVSEKKFIQNEGKKILQFYSNDIENLLEKNFPNFPWTCTKKFNFNLIDNQRKFMDNIYKEFSFNSFDEWKNLQKQKMIEKGGKNILLIYKNDLKNLLSSIYPNYPFNEMNFRSINSFQSLNRQIEFIEELYKKLSLKSLSQWQKITKNQINQMGGHSLLSIYSHDIRKLFSSIYPNFPWNFPSKKSNLFNLKTQREFMDQLYDRFQFNSLDDWNFVSKSKFIENGGKSLLENYYANSMQKLLISVYPLHNWCFFNSFQRLKSIEIQRKFLEYFFKKLKLNSLEDWLFVSLKTFKQNCWKNLLKNYSPFSLKKMLVNIYPDYDWPFLKLKCKNYLQNIENQRKIVNYFFRKFKLKKLDDWLKISRHKFIIRGGKFLLANFYENNMKKFLISIYPNHIWCFNNFQYREMKKGEKSFEYHFLFLKNLKKKFNIEKKNDWFRMNSKFNEINLIKSLKLIYPNEKWQKNHFQNRSKKTNQRLLFIQLQNIFKYYYLLEDYKHPHMNQNNPLEFDIFIPSFNLAFEYQGEHHYNDIPAFGKLDTYLYRDQDKIYLSIENQIPLILVPYWWNFSQSSLFNLIQSQFLFKL